MPLVIRGGLVVDGTGTEPLLADVLIDDDRIVDLQAHIPTPPGAGRVIDAAGLVVCPGFIDIHSHGELVVALPADRQRVLQAGRIAQGITTQVVGNCGIGVFPCDSEMQPVLRSVVSWMTPPEADDWPAGKWSDLATYFDHLQSNGTWTNVGALQPHGPLRAEVTGLARSRLTPEGLAVMSRQLEAALDAGAFGLSTGLIYPPGMYSETGEIIALAGVLRHATRDGAFVASHIRGSSETLLPAVNELLEVGRRAGVRVQHSHSEAVGRRHWGKIARVLRMEEDARRSGVAVAYDMFPYTAAATMMLAIYPPWALDGGVDRLLARLADAGSRAAIETAIETTTPTWPPWTRDGWPHNLIKAVGWNGVTIGSVASECNGRYEGMNLVELGRARGKRPFDAISDLMIEERGAVSQIIHGVSGEEGHEAGIEMLLDHQAGAIITDADDFGKGKPHPAAFGTYPRVLGRYVRQRRLLSLAEAVHKMTGYPARLLGLKDRGLLRRGMFADLVVLDPEAIGSDATYDEPRRPARGIRWVLVNGRPILAPDGEQEAADPPGAVLRRER